MNLDETVLTQELRDAISALDPVGEPPLAAITRRGRAHRRRRRVSMMGYGIACAAAAGVLTLGLTSAPKHAPARNVAAIPTTAPSSLPSTTQSAAFILTSNVNGTDTLELTMSQMLDPDALQQALTQHGIPAVVKTNTYCTSNPGPPDPVSAGVLSIHVPGSTPSKAVRATTGSSNPAASNQIVARDMKQLAANTITVINPAAIPSGAELFFGYSPSGAAIFTDLIYTSSYSCSANP